MSEAKQAKPPNSLEKSKVSYVDAGCDNGFGNPLLERIRTLLTQTEPEKWRIGGEELTNESRFQRPRSTHEQILVRDIPNGSLALRSSQPVTSQYVPGGYMLNPVGPPSYTIEVRDCIFDADKVVDPRYADNQKGKRCDVVASGVIAKSLYIQVRETIRSNTRERKKTFDERVRDLVETIVERIAETTIEEWQKTTEQTKDEEDITYTTELEGIQVAVSRKVKDWESHFRLMLREEKFSYDKASSSLARTCFQKLEELEQNAQLVALNEVLKGLGFEER